MTASFLIRQQRPRAHWSSQQVPNDQANPEIEYKITRQTNWCSRQVRVSMKHILPGYHHTNTPQTWAGRTKGPGWDFIWQMILNRSLLNNASRTISQTSLTKNTNVPPYILMKRESRRSKPQNQAIPSNCIFFLFHSSSC